MLVMECREFCDLLLLLRDDLQEKDIPHRTKLCKAIVTTWKSGFLTLKRDLAVSVTNLFLEWHIIEPFFQEAASRISFTADVWSDNNWRGYLAITCQWISRDKATRSLQLKRALLAFHHLHGGHNGNSMAKAVLHLLDRAGITAQVYFIV